MNSNLTDNEEIRKFGLIAFIFFGCLCTVGLWMKKPLPIYFFGFLSFLGLGFVLIPSRLRPVYAAWLKFAHYLGKVVTTLILTLSYYFVITPAGLVKRLLGGRPLPVRHDKEALSYWVERDESAQPIERFLKRY